MSDSDSPPDRAREMPAAWTSSPAYTLGFIAGYLELTINATDIKKGGRYLTKDQIQRLIDKANAALSGWVYYEAPKCDGQTKIKLSFDDKSAPFDGTYRLPDQT